MMSCFPNHTQALLLKACTSPSGSQAVDFFEQWKNTIDIDLDGADSRELGLPQVYDTLDFGSQRLLSLLYYQLTNHGFEDPTINKLKGYFKYVWVKNQLISEDLRQISDTLRANNISAIAFKGVRIATYYPHIGTRPAADLDLIIHPEDVKKADPVLLKMGWSIKKFPSRISDMTDLLSHAISLIKGNQELDLHIRFSQYLFKSKTRELFWESARKTENGVLHLAPAHELFCVVLHGMVNGPIPTIRWVADAVFIIRTFTENDWEEFLQLTHLEEYGLLIKRALKYLIDEEFISTPGFLASSFMDSIPTNQNSPYIDLLTRERKENDFNMFRRHYLTATQMSKSYISRWKLLIRHYKTRWKLTSNKDLITRASKVIASKVVSPEKK